MYSVILHVEQALRHSFELGRSPLAGDLHAYHVAALCIHMNLTALALPLHKLVYGRRFMIGPGTGSKR